MNETTSTELVPSVSIDAVVERRNVAVERVRKAHALLVEANDAMDATFGGEDSGRYYHVDLQDRCTRHVFTSAEGLDEQVRRLDAAHWDWLLKKSGLMTFMDAAAREVWNRNIADAKVPELTRENIEATFEQLYGSRGEMFERGVVALFRKLSWVYKTNTPVKFGKRLVLTHMIDAYSNHGTTKVNGLSFSGADKLDDLVRVLSVLDGKPEPDHRNGTWHRANEARFAHAEGSMRAALDYIELRGFKNGNAHATFTRPDLVDKLNAIIAKHHPNALPPAKEST